MGPLLTLDSVAVCEVQSVLESFNANFAKIRLAGTVQGTADGAATSWKCGPCTCSIASRSGSRELNLAVRERRSIGGATPGLDAVAKLQISVEPLEKSAQPRRRRGRQGHRGHRTPARDLVYESRPAGLPLQARSAMVSSPASSAKRSRCVASTAATWWPNAR